VKCDYKRGTLPMCGSAAFNLKSEGIDQGGLCDRHYWQVRWQRAIADKEAMRVELEVLRASRLPSNDGKTES